MPATLARKLKARSKFAKPTGVMSSATAPKVFDPSRNRGSTEGTGLGGAKPKPPSAKPNSGLAFSPFDATARPPAGSYDPAIDAEEDAANRGFGYADQDYGRDTGRLNADFSIATENLGRQYNFLKNRQTGSARAQGVDLGGWKDRSQQTRNENQGREQDSLRLAWERASSDALSNRERAGIENIAFQGDAQESRIAQANQNTPGWSDIEKVTKAGYRVDNVDRTDEKGPFRFARNLKTGKLVKVRPDGSRTPR